MRSCARALCGGLLLSAAPAAAQEPGPRPLTVALGVSAGMQYDARPCTLAGREATRPDVPACVLFAGGTDLSLLWRGLVGGALGLYGSAGQAVKTGQAPAIPDRVSVPMAVELRPLAFLRAAAEESWRGRALSGLALRLGPSVELVRTASDSDASMGVYLGLLSELPLTAARQHGVSLRLALHLLGAPLTSLNEGAVRSAPFESCAPMPGCTPLTERHHGFGVVAQSYAGLVYYP